MSSRNEPLGRRCVSADLTTGRGPGILLLRYDGRTRAALSRRIIQLAGDIAGIIHQPVKLLAEHTARFLAGAWRDLGETGQKPAQIDGRPLDVRIIGTDEYYPQVRNLQLIAGRFLDPSDVALRQKVAMLDDKLARTLFGGPAPAVGHIVKIRSLEFTIIGVFRERTSTFGQSELGDHGAALIPYSVQRYFVEIERVDPMYVQVRYAEDVPAVTREVADILSSRHRPGARYTVQNLSAILDAAAAIAAILTVVLILISAIALVISGIGIMNIMLVTVTERTREIGIRMSLGASRRVILLQFLFEALLISTGGGVIGILLGVSLPVIANSLQSEVYIPVSKLSILVAFLVSAAVGIGFGLLPANRAACLNPTEALRYE